MRHVMTIFRKQVMDTLRNKAVLIQFVMFPVMAVIMTRSVQIEGMPPHFFIKLFAAMYVGMAPLVSMAAILSEEKEKNTLRVLLMAHVTPWQYLAGVGSYVFACCMLGAAAFCLMGNYNWKERGIFLLIMAVGILASLLLGAAVGAGSNSQMAATSVTVPVMLFFSFLPMLSTFNDSISKVAKYTYTEQIRLMLEALDTGENARSGLVVIAGNVLLFGCAFATLYRKLTGAGASLRPAKLQQNS